MVLKISCVKLFQYSLTLLQNVKIADSKTNSLTFPCPGIFSPNHFLNCGNSVLKLNCRYQTVTLHLVYCLLTRLWCQVHTQRRHHVLIGIFIKLSHQKIIILHSQWKFLHIYKTKIICLLTSISSLKKVLHVHFWFESLWKQTGGVTLGKHSKHLTSLFKN